MDTPDKAQMSYINTKDSCNIDKLLNPTSRKEASSFLST